MTITLYIPPSKPAHDVRAFLTKERALASNIKDKTTRKEIEQGLSSLLSQFESHISERGAILVYDQGLRVLEPPTAVDSFIYRCGKEAYLGPLEEMRKPKRVAGLVVLDRRECSIGRFGHSLDVVDSFESQVPGKHGQGGQSSRRFERLIEEAARDWLKKCASRVDDSLNDCAVIVVGGPGRTKEEILPLLDYRLRERVRFADVGYTNEAGLRELVDAAEEEVLTEEQRHRTGLLRRFLKEVATDGKAAYGDLS